MLDAYDKHIICMLDGRNTLVTSVDEWKNGPPFASAHISILSFYTSAAKM